jgi:transcriptional regulator with XRE-family HTH domain
MKFLKKPRIDKGLSMAEVARRLSISGAAYHRMENTSKGMQLESLCKIRKLYGWSWKRIGELIDEEFASH